ncbi:hypothetical protein [Clostridium botulinum]|uniref:hypothetical protein n=1 Tax=Clostridium botulinum TaxID=1491 RepID=UPI003DA5BA18
MKQGQRVLLDDNGEMTTKDGDLVRWFTCMQCNEYVIAKEIYENQNVVCPHCNRKFKVRLYKNNTIRIAVR